MNVIKSYYILNIKMLIKEKVAFLWALVLPSVFLLINLNNITQIEDLRFFWAYMIVTSYVFGIGLQAVRLRNFGMLKTYFSIKEAKLEFFLACLLTQLVFNTISLVLFNATASLLLNFSFIELTQLALKMMVMSIPMSFLTFSFVLFKRVRYETMNTIASMCLFLFLLLSFYSFNINYINPIIILGNLISIQEPTEYIFYFFISLVLISIGLVSSKKYSVYSEEQR